MTIRSMIAAAATLAISVVAAAGEPPKKQIETLVAAEFAWNKQYEASAHAQALAIAEEALADHEAAATASLAKAREQLQSRVDGWERAALRLRYVRAISLRELKRWTEAREALAALAEQELDRDVQQRATKALAALMEQTTPVHIYCSEGRSFHLHPRGSKSRGNVYTCSGGRKAVDIPAHPGEYVLIWENDQDGAGRFVTVGMGPPVHVHLFDQATPIAPPYQGGCASARL